MPVKVEDRVFQVHEVPLGDAVPVADLLVEERRRRLARVDVEVLAHLPAAVAELVALEELRGAEDAGAKEDAGRLDVEQAGGAVVAVEDLGGDAAGSAFFDVQVADADFAVDVGAVGDGGGQEVLVH